MADPDEPLKPAFNYSPSATVILLVGKHEEEMLAHADYHTARSDSFKAALSKAWKESQTRVIKLPEDDPATVAQYLDFCYHKYRLPPAAEIYLRPSRVHVLDSRQAVRLRRTCAR